MAWGSRFLAVFGGIGQLLALGARRARWEMEKAR
jgi:hypothetical protein